MANPEEHKEGASLSEAIRIGFGAGLITFGILGIPFGLVALSLGSALGSGTIYGVLGIVFGAPLVAGFAATMVALTSRPTEWNDLATTTPDRQTPTVHKRRRPPIPKRVKEKVWERDGGRCVECESPHKIHFAHIIPYSWGGS